MYAPDQQEYSMPINECATKYHSVACYHYVGVDSAMLLNSTTLNKAVCVCARVCVCVSVSVCMHLNINLSLICILVHCKGSSHVRSKLRVASYIVLKLVASNQQ